MDDQKGTETSAAMASRIEKTLSEQESKRILEAKIRADTIGQKPGRRGSQYFSYLMLLLGVIAGALLGAVLYFLVLGQAPAEHTDIKLVDSPELIEADRLFSLGEYDSARKVYQSILATNPAVPRPYNNLASLYAAEGDLEQARVLLSKALKTNSDYLTVYRNIGMVYAAMARDSYGKALQLEGEMKQVQLQMLGSQDLATVATGRSDPAKPVATKPVATKPVASKPVASKPVASKPVASKPVASKPVATKPVATKPVASKPVASKPVATKPVATKPVATKPVATKPVATKPVVALGTAVSDPSAGISAEFFLHGWAKAWSAQDVRAYLAFYAADYVPVGKLSRTSWQQNRNKRLTTPSFIKVALEQVETLKETADIVEIQLVQSYRSDRYRDRTRKKFVLRRKAQTWEILAERSLGQVR